MALLHSRKLRVALTSRRLRYGLLGIGCCWFYLVFLHGHNRSTVDQLHDNVEQALNGDDPPQIKTEIDGWIQEVDVDSDCSVFNRNTPLIVRNAIQDWPALQKWNFDWIHTLNATADVLISPSLVFTTYNKYKKTPSLALESPPGTIPAVFGKMSSEEALQRMSNDGHHIHKKLYYNKDSDQPERYYMRFDVEDDLYDDINLDEGLFKCLKLAGSPRLWISVEGSVSPMHWDTQSSCLVQIRGTKRMLLFSSVDIDKFGSYSAQNALYRRSKFDPTNPDYKTYPKAKEAKGSLGIVHAGDMLCFPSKFVHYTDSLTHSISMVIRRKD